MFRSVLEMVKGAAAGGLLYAFVACTPMPAPRPRVTKTGHAYMPKPYTEFSQTLQAGFAKAVPHAPFEGPLVALVEIVSARPKSTILPAPRGDVDNHAKGPLDAATKTGRFWKDDVQITDLFVTKRWSEPGEEPGVHLYVAQRKD